jgi:DNA-binding CsgD family transcriptional regulator
MIALHLAIPRVHQGELDRALELALQPSQSDVQFTDSDRSLIHSIAALCYTERQEFHGALFQINKEFELVKQSGNSERISQVLGNLAAILSNVGAWEPAGRAASEAWNLQLKKSTDQRGMQVATLANALRSHTHLGRLDTAKAYAEQLIAYLGQQELPTHALMHADLAMFFSRRGETESAKWHLERAHMLAQGSDTAHVLEIAGVLLLECQKAYTAAIKAARSLLDLPPKQVLLGFRIILACSLQRCHKALGNEIETQEWKRFEEEAARSLLLSDSLINQSNAISAVADFSNPLTERELTCLRLSAHGQTSADIALKLGMKTRTVNFHFGNILRKLNAMNRQEAIAKAVSANLLKRD